MGYVFCLIFHDFTLITTLKKRKLCISCPPWKDHSNWLLSAGCKCINSVVFWSYQGNKRAHCLWATVAHSSVRPFVVRSSVWLSIKQIRILGMHHPSRFVILETVYLRSCRNWWSFCLSISNWQNTSITGCLWATSTVTKQRYATKAGKKIKKLWS